MTSIEFASWARIIVSTMRERGLGPVPGFRSPPADPSLDRALRTYPDGQISVSVRIAGREPRDVLLDMLAGAVAVAGIDDTSAAAGEFRAEVVRLADVDVLPRPIHDPRGNPTG